MRKMTFSRAEIKVGTVTRENEDTAIVVDIVSGLEGAEDDGHGALKRKCWESGRDGSMIGTLLCIRTGEYEK
jgi:hypothetical protein